MRILLLMIFVVSLSFVVNARVNNKATLSGSVFDADGALISGIKVTAVDRKGEKFDTLTNQEGICTLDLSYTIYEAKLAHLFKMAKYEITLNRTNVGFQKYTIKDFNFVHSSI